MKKKLCFTLDSEIIKMMKVFCALKEIRMNKLIEDSVREYINNHTTE